MKRILILPTIFVLFLIPAFAQTKESQKSIGSKILITIEKNGMWFRPAFTAQIYDDGTVIYKGEDLGDSKSKKQYKISKDKIQELVEEFQRINYFSLADSYYNGTEDATTTITSISLNGKQKKVINYAGPPQLYKLEDKIEEVIDVQRFYGFKDRLDIFFAALTNYPDSRGVMVNYGTARNIGRRNAEIRRYAVFRKYDLNRVKFVSHIRTQGIKTEFQVVKSDR